jgi:RNA polymerase-binding transcription factor DksA
MSRIHTPKEFARLRNEVKALNEELIFQRRENINNFERGVSIAVEQVAKLEAAVKQAKRRGGECRAMNERFFCENCNTPIPERRVKLVRLLPATRAPWPLFEYLEKPVCPVCDGDLVDMMWTGAGHGNPPYTTPPDCLADEDKDNDT